MESDHTPPPQGRLDHTRLRDAARSYAARGWRVFPCHTIVAGRCTCHAAAACGSPGKHPRTEHGCLDGTTDQDQIRIWWQKWPNANVGIATGRDSNLAIIDIDPEHGGEDALAALESHYGAIPQTVEVVSGGSGRHFYCSYPAELTIKNSTGDKDRRGIDIRGDGGYVIAPPSLHLSGRCYEWELTHHPEEISLAPFPSWALPADRAAAPASSQNGYRPAFVMPDHISEGGRNDTMFRLGCSLRGKWLTEDMIRAVLASENQAKCHPPLPDRELEAILKQVARYAQGHAREEESPPEEDDAEPLTIDPKASPTMDLFDAFREDDERFRKTWEHKRRDFKSQDIEVYEYSLARQASIVEWPPQEIVNLLIYHRRKYGAPPRDLPYYRRILRKTSTSTGKSDEEAMTDADTQEAMEGGEDAVITLIRERLGVPFAKLLKRGKQKALYSFLLDDGEEIALGPIEVLANPRAVQIKILEVTRILIKKFKEEEWRKLINLFGPLTIEIDVGGDRKHQIFEWVSQYIDNADRFSFPPALANSDPVIEDGTVFINVMSLRRYLNKRWLENVEDSRVRALLSEAGFTRITVPGRIKGKVYSRSYWKISLAALENYQEK